jgi:hypothetical protein
MGIGLWDDKLGLEKSLGKPDFRKLPGSLHFDSK